MSLSIVNQINHSQKHLENWSNGGIETLTSFSLCCSLLQRKVPNRQLYRWSRMVTKKYSLNSNAEGNFIKTNTAASLESLNVLVWRNLHTSSLFLTCLVSCQTQSTNWIKTGERSASVWFLSPWPIRLDKFQMRTISGGARRFTCHWKCWK